MKEPVDLGDRVRDRISGLEGIVTGIATYLYGGPDVRISPESCTDFQPAEPQWMDMRRVEVKNKKVLP